MNKGSLQFLFFFVLLYLLARFGLLGTMISYIFLFGFIYLASKILMKVLLIKKIMRKEARRARKYNVYTNNNERDYTTTIEICPKCGHEKGVNHICR